jgi:glycosyltransferase involved in cell wall biosynthesis
MADAQRHYPSGDAPIETRWLAPPDKLSLELQHFSPDLLHVHGLWSVANRILARGSWPPSVIAPQGMLDPWALNQSRCLKQAAWSLYEQGNLQRCAAVQALSLAEFQSIRAKGIRAPVAIIPNAVSLPHRDQMNQPPPPWSRGHERVLLFFSRFHHKKGLTPLLQAWHALESAPASRGWRLVLVGYGDQGRLARSVAQAQARGHLLRVEVHGPCFGADKQACFSAASAFVLPSFSEGLPMAALEAMAHRLPCLLSAACNLPEAFSAGAALVADADPGALAAALQHLFGLSDAERASMGSAAAQLVANSFSWTRVAEQTLALYRWILGASDRPAWVELG